MRLLVLGGTRFLGLAIVDEAIRRGYDVTTFSRGLSGEPRPGAEALHGDRTNSTDLLRVAERDFDLVIDTSVIAPRHVAASARLLAPRVRHYTYVSTLSVYAGFGEVPVSEKSPVLDCPPDADGSVEELGYGELKAGSERAVAQELPGRHLIVRPGLLVGPHENIGRLPWWLTRIARGGTVLAPGQPGRPVRMTDARDLAAWIVDNTRRGIPGVVNVPGPEGTTFGELLTGQHDQRRTGWAGRRPGLRWRARAAAAALGAGPGACCAAVRPALDRSCRCGRRGRRSLRPSGTSAGTARCGPACATGPARSDTVRDTRGWLPLDATARGGDLTGTSGPGMGLDPAKEAGDPRLAWRPGLRRSGEAAGPGHSPPRPSHSGRLHPGPAILPPPGRAIPPMPAPAVPFRPSPPRPGHPPAPGPRDPAYARPRPRDPAHSTQAARPRPPRPEPGRAARLAIVSDRGDARFR